MTGISVAGSRKVRSRSLCRAACVGTEAPWNIGRFYGSSYFVDPRGQFLAEGSEDKDEVVVADLDLKLVYLNPASRQTLKKIEQFLPIKVEQILLFPISMKVINAVAYVRTLADHGPFYATRRINPPRNARRHNATPDTPH